jgi:hypothetical protein
MSDKKKTTKLDDSDIVENAAPTRRSFLTKTGVAAGLAAAGMAGLTQPATASDPVGGGSDTDPNDPYGGGSDTDPNDPIGEGTDYD